MESGANWDQLRNLVRKTIKTLQRDKPTHVEAFFTCSLTTEATIRNSEVLTGNRLEDSGLGFRVVAERNKVGFACTNRLDEKTVLETGKRALSIARLSSETPDFALPEASRPTQVDGLFDQRIADVTIDNVIRCAEDCIETAEGSDERVIAKDGRVLFMAGWRGIINTLGVDLEEEETKAILYLGGSGKQEDEVTSSCYSSQFTRKADLSPEKAGREVSEMVVGLFKPKSLESLKGQVILAPEAVSYQLCDVLIDSVKADSVIAGKSAWTDKVGQEVSSEQLTVLDDPILVSGFSSRGFDDEGCPSARTSLIKNGQLEGFLHQASTSKTLGTKNTGNASRFAGGFDMAHMIVGNGYRTKPEIYASNLMIKPGARSKDELVREVDRGVLIESMAGFAQKGSGVISAQLSRAFYIKNGEIQHPIKGGMVSGNGLDWLKQISVVGSDLKQFQNVVVPSLLIDDVKVVGA